MQLSHTNKRHACTALANLAKFQGKYDEWSRIRRAYDLKWSSGCNASIQSMQRFFNPSLTLESMLQTIRQMVYNLPTSMGQIVKFALLTGLRPAEAVESVMLINSNAFDNYYDSQQMTLCHYKFSQFLRTTKKCYISFVTPEMLSGIRYIEKVPSYNAIRLTCKRRGFKMDMRLCRKVFGSWLHKYGISTEIVDFLQGRVSTSVFSRHYLTPDSSLKDRVLTALHELEKSL